jgi:ribokinase
MGPVGRVLVVGSINSDVVLRVTRRPARGETLLAESVTEFCGGKGANQAVAAARAGAEVELVGAVGADARGRAQLRALRDAGVSTEFVAVKKGVPTGLAVITITPDGENSIVVAAGANERVGAIPDRPADVVVAQTEIATSAVDSAAALGVRFVLNAAPVVALAPATLALADPLVVNGLEARTLLRLLGAEVPSKTGAVAEQLRAHVRSVIVTMGGAGALVLDDTLTIVSAPAADAVVDTTGAGDVFAGTLAAALADGRGLVPAAETAVAAATASVGRRGPR